MSLQHFLIINVFYKHNEKTVSITTLLIPYIVISICFTLVSILLFIQPVLLGKLEESRKKKREESLPSKPKTEIKEEKEEENRPEMRVRSLLRNSGFFFWLAFTFLLFFFAPYLGNLRDGKDPSNWVSSIFLGICLLCGFFYLIPIVFMHKSFKYM